ncbi:MAG: pilus assembly protein, partial [Coriobacteriales bacterium]|nr:pilus assembly protein [Coriobacteriales bacterium]
GSRALRNERGQMVVELAVCLPVLLAVFGVVINLMVYFDACARFDRVAAEAVRLHAVSPSSGYETDERALTVQGEIQDAFVEEEEYISIEVTGEARTDSYVPLADSAVMLSPYLETYVCEMCFYPPFPFSNNGSFFGIEFSGLVHHRFYTVDPYRPGVLF